MVPAVRMGLYKFLKYKALPGAIFLVSLLISPVQMFSQEEKSIFIHDIPFTGDTCKPFSLWVNSLSFFRNNEFKSPYVSGYTLTGTRIRPRAIFYPAGNLRIEAGGEVLAYNGRDDYKLSPWFSVVYVPVRDITFRMGNLNNDQNHGLPEYLRDVEHFVNGRSETGIQALVQKKRLKADLWIDWQQMIFPGDPFKEQFVFGTAAEWIIRTQAAWQISLPLYFHGMHRGGEIDAAAGPAYTWITVSEGLKMNKNLMGRFFRSMFLEAGLLQSTYPQSQTALPSSHGSAVSLQTGVVTELGKVGAGIWQGNRFYTPLGMPLYQNTAEGSGFYSDPNRLMTLNYDFHRKIFGESWFGFTFNLYYNTGTQKISNSAALYLVINFQAFGKKK